MGGRSEYFDSNSEETGADSHVGGPLTRKRTQEEGWLGLPFLCSEGKNSDRQMGNGLNHCTSIGWGGGSNIRDSDSLATSLSET